MRGRELCRTSTDCPYAGGLFRDFTREDITAFGKLNAWGDAVTRYLVRLSDGREFFVKANKQSKDDERWLRKIARKVKQSAPGRQEGWRVKWIKLQENE